MVNSGYEFIEGSFRSKLMSFFEADDASGQQRKDQAINMFFVTCVRAVR